MADMILPERPFLGCPVADDVTQLDADVVILGSRTELVRC
jgi:hypothetical protein